jgi:hypothetical protein
VRGLSALPAFILRIVKVPKLGKVNFPDFFSSRTSSDGGGARQLRGRDRLEIWGIMTIGVGPAGMLPTGDSRMEWTLRLVGRGIDGQSRSFDVMAISRLDGLGDIANLGLTLAEAKLLLAQVQQQVVAGQANTHAMFRPDCRSCGATCQVKDWQPHRIATLFGKVRARLPRLVCGLRLWRDRCQLAIALSVDP